MENNIRDFMDNLSKKDIKLWLEGDELRYTGPAVHISKAVLSSILDKKSEIVATLKAYKNKDGAYVPTANQIGLFLEQKKNPDSWDMHNIIGFRLSVATPLDLIKKVFSMIVDNFVSLRLSFYEEDKIHINLCEYVMPNIQFFNSCERIADECADEITKEVRKPFEINGGVLYRIHVHECKDAIVVVFCAHHLITDAVSFQIITNAFWNLMNGGSLPKKPKHTFLQYLLWKNEEYQKAGFSKRINFFKNILKDANEPASLPIIRKNTPEGYVQKKVVHDFNLHTSKEIREVAAKLNMTVFTFMFSILAYVVNSYEPKNNIVLGTFGINRYMNNIDLSDDVGYFSNLLPIPVDIPYRCTFAEYCRLFKERFFSALEYQDVEFYKLVELINPVRQGEKNPFFNVVFDSMVLPRKKESHGNRLEKFEIDQGIGNFDLFIWFFEVESKYRFDLRYNENLFLAEQITQFLSTYQTVLESVLIDPNKPLYSIPLISDHDYQLLEDFNKTERDYEKTTLDRIVDGYVKKRYFERMIYSDTDNKSINYAEMGRYITHFSHVLQGFSVSRGDKVAVCMKKRITLLPLIMAIWKLGAVYVPIDPEFPSLYKKNILINVQAVLVVNDTEHKDWIGDKSKQVWVIEEPNDLIDEAEMQESNSHSEDVAYIIHTSGSTGMPKGVMIKHHSIINLLQYLARELKVGEDDVFSSLSPICFDMSISEMFLPLYLGASVSLADVDLVKNSERLNEFIKKREITVMHGTPTTYEVMYTKYEHILSNMRVAICAGEPFGNDLVKKAGQISKRFVNLYGPAETTVFSTRYAFTNENEPISIGKPIDNTKVIILNNMGQIMPPWTVGEIHIGGDGLLVGYSGNETDKGILAESYLGIARWYKTGDIAYYNEEGNIYLIGRSDEQLKIRGHRIELNEIEYHIKQYPSITDSAVSFEYKPNSVTSINAFIVTMESIDFKSLKKYLMMYLPEYAIPQRFYVIDAIPLNRSNKIDYKKLRNMANDLYSQNEEQHQDMACNEIEERLLNIYIEVLDTKNLRVNDNFFDMGGNSLLLNKLQIQIQKCLQIDINIIDLFKHTTIRELAIYITEGNKEQNAVDIGQRKEIRKNYILRKKEALDKMK